MPKSFEENKLIPGSIPVWLTIREQELLILMKWLDSKNAFDLRCGRIIIDFDKDNKIGNLKIETNYKLYGEV